MLIIIKYTMLLFLLLFTSILGIMLSKKYTYRVQELKNMQNALNILENKIRFTYEPLNEIFNYIAENSSRNISNIFKVAKKKMEKMSASKAWEEAIDTTDSYLNKEDKITIKMLSKLLGITDIEGQISQIEITKSFLKKQIDEAEKEKQKNEKLYKKLGFSIGTAIVIILI